MRRLHVLIFLVLFLGALGCEEPNITPEQAGPFVEQWAQQLGPTLEKQTSEAAASASLKERFLAGIEAEAKRLNRKEPAYNRLAEELYIKREYKPGLVTGSKLTPAGEKILEALEGVEADGFILDAYRPGEVHEKLAKLEELSAEFEGLGEFSAGQAERDFVLSQVTLKKGSEFSLDDTSYEAMNQALMESDAGKELSSKLERYAELSAQMAAEQADIEQILSTGLLRYAYNLRYFNKPDIFVHKRQDDYYNDPEIQKRRPDDARGAYRAGQTWRKAIFAAQNIQKKRGAELTHRHLQGVLTAALEAKDAAGMSATLTTLSPGPQYDALRKEFTRYKQIVKAGGWEEVPAQKRLSRGQKKDVVKALKKRLQIEGYFPKNKELSTLFDQDLTDAIKAYQRAHQMTADGKPGRSFWRSINVSAKRRTKQIELNLKRWRDSNIQHHDQDLYVLVNIPDFHAEIWKEQERQMRMRIVVGNNDEEEDEETGEKERPNRTPTVSAYIDRVIYNPYWNVTPRIREDEILVDVRKDLEPIYANKVDTMLGITEVTSPEEPTGTSPSPTGLQGAATGAVIPKPYTKTKEGWKLDIAKFQQLHEAKHGAPADIAAAFPYLSEETGLVDVSTTDPNNIPPWYAKNGYEVMHPGKKWEFVRQLNGDDNSLGRVKVIFPNLHDVYLHDTPHKALFKRDIRAFSHGCMRMHQPLDFAQWLMANDGQYNEAKIKKQLKEKVYSPYFLREKVPVHVEYFTVRPDDEGRANFLIDIYDKDVI